MAKITTTTEQTTKPAFLIRQGAVGPGEHSTDYTSLIKGVGGLIGGAASVAAEEKIKSAVQESIDRSNADIEGQQKRQIAFEEETKFADPDEDQFDIEARGNAAAVQAFNNALSQKGDAAITTDPSLTRGFGETNKLIQSYQQGRTPASVFQSRMAARIVNMRARFPHARKEIDKYVSSKLGYDPLAKELALEQKRQESLIDLEVDEIKRDRDYIFDHPFLANSDPDKQAQNIAVWKAQEANLKREKQVLELQAARGASVKQQQAQFGQSIAASYTQLVTENLMTTINEAVKSGSSLELLKSNQNVVQAMAMAKQNFIKELNRQGVTDTEAFKSAIELFDTQTKHIRDLMNHENFEKINGAIIDAYSTDMGRKLLSHPGQLGAILRATNAFIAAGGKSGPQLREFMANFMLEASNMSNADFYQKTMDATNLINGQVNPPPNLFNLMDPSKLDAPIAGIAKVTKPATQQEANMHVPSIVAGLKAMSSGSIASPQNVDVVMSNIVDIADEYVVNSRQNLAKLGPALSNPNWIKNVKEAKIGSDKASKAASIVSGNMLSLHDSLKKLDDFTAKPHYTMDEQGRLVLGFEHDTPTNFADRGGREFAEQQASKVLSPILEEANRHMDAYLTYKEMTGVPRKQVIDELRSVLGNNLGPIPRDVPEDTVKTNQEPSVEPASSPSSPTASPTNTPTFKIKDTQSVVDDIMNSIDPERAKEVLPDIRSQMEKDIEDIKKRWSSYIEDREIARKKKRVSSVIGRVRNDMDKKVLEYQLKKHEGIKYKAYKDTEGNMTIGVGHKILPNEKYLLTKELTDEEVEELFIQDMDTAISESEKLPFFKGLDDVRQNVVVNMVYNMGKAGYEKFKKSIEGVTNGDYVKAAVEMLDSKWATQVKGRAEELATQMLTGVTDAAAMTKEEILSFIATDEDAANKLVKTLNENKKASTILFKEVVPDAVRFFVDYKLTGRGKTATEEDLSEDAKAYIKQLIQKAEAEGRTSVGYEDYDKTQKGLTGQEVVENAGNKRTSIYGDGIGGFISMSIDTGKDAVLNTMLTLGQFDFKKQPDGSYIVTDKYDFSKSKKKKGGDVYNYVRSSLTEGGTPYKVRARI